MTLTATRSNVTEQNGIGTDRKSAKFTLQKSQNLQFIDWKYPHDVEKQNDPDPDHENI